MKKDKYAPGEPCWIDCGTDLTKAPPFYAALFGWSMLDLGPQAGGYQMAQLDGETVAAFGPQQAPGHPFWNIYFCTHDAGATKDKVLAAGGTVIAEPMDVMGEGTMAVFADTTGAAFSVWQPGNTKGLGEIDSVGTFCWAELITTDVEGSKTFYGHVFGWSSSDSEDNSMDYTEFQLGVTSIAGMMPKPDSMPAQVPPHWVPYFAVDDTDATAARAVELGGTALLEPSDSPAGRLAVFADAVGAVFSVIALSMG